MRAAVRHRVLLLAALLALPSSAHASDPATPGSGWANESAGAPERTSLLTRDGVRATLYRYTPRLPRGAAVLLLPDVGLTWRSYDFAGRGLAPYLSRKGFEVFVLEYRGAGVSEVPLGGYRLEDLLDADAEAAFRVASTSDVKRPLVVAGTGLGGTLALVLASRHPEAVAGVVGLQAAALLEVPNEPVEQLLPKLAEAPRWADLATLSGAPLFFGRSWFEILLAGDGAIPKDQLGSLRKHVLAPVPRQVTTQLVSFMRAGKIQLAGKDLRELVAGWRGPTLLTFAPRDNWIHPEYSTPLRRVLDPARTEVEVLTVMEGASLDYGHLGMLLGEHADVDVWARVRDFVEARR